MKQIFRKGLVWSIIVLFIGLSVIPTISGINNKSIITSPIEGGDPDILWKVEGHTRSVNGVSFSNDGLTVASGAYDPDNTAKIWQADDGTLLKTYPGNEDGIISVDISSDNQFLAVGYIVTGYPPGGKMNLWDITGETIVNDFGGCHVCFSPDGEFIASGGGGANRYLYVHRVSNGEKLWGDTTGAYVSDVKFSPDGQYVASSGSDNKVKLWDAETGELVRTLSGHTNDVSCIAFSSDSQFIASGTGGYDDSEESNIKIWKVSDGSLIRTLEGHEEWVYDVEFVPGGEYLVSSGREDTSPLELHIKFWRVSSGDQHLFYDELALDLEYSPTGDYFVYGQSNGNIVVAKSPILPENKPPERPAIEGPDTGVPGTEYIYVLNAVDPDNDDIRYHIDWGDDNSEITEFNPSGTDLIVKHTWTQKGTYIISVYAEDVNGLIGPTATNPIIIPRTKVLNLPFFQFIQKHQNLFSQIKILLGL
jgi:WD40 repeat protein